MPHILAGLFGATKGKGLAGVPRRNMGGNGSASGCSRGFPFCVSLLVLSSFLVASSAFGQGEERPVATPKKGKTQSLVFFMNYPYQITGDGVTKLHVVLLKPDFTPAKGAAVKINGKPVGKADENGTAIFDFKPGSNEAHKLSASYADSSGNYEITKGFSCNARTESFRSDQLFVYTDRGAYNPGDDILVRILAWELLGDYKAIKGANASLMLQSPGGKILGGQKVVTDEFGVAAARFLLPEHMPEGNYELIVLYNQARETARLRVERFVAPVMDIKHDLKRFLTSAQEELPVNVTLSYFSGGIPQGATLTAAILSDDKSPLVTVKMDEVEPGKFKTTFGKKDLDDARAKIPVEQPFKIRIEAKDKFGRKSHVDRDMVYTQRPYRAVLELDKDDYPQGEPVKLIVRVVDLDGRPAKEIELTTEVEQFKVDLKGKTDDAGVAIFTFPMGSSSAQAVVKSPVMPVPLGQRELYMNQPKPMVSKVEDPPRKQGIQTTVKVTFHKDFVPVEKVVHVDLTDISGALVASTTIPVTKGKDGEFRAEGTVTAPTWGTMLANLYVAATKKENAGKKLTIDNVGFITEGQHITLYPDSEGKIVVEGLKPRVKPGERLEVKVSVEMKSGEEAALGASLVDDAVLSLMEPLEKTPQEHFYNPQLKVVSTGGAGVLTWPVVDRNWGNPWRDIAYTNWGFKEPGTWVGRDDDDSFGEGGGGGFGMGGKGVGGGGAAMGATGLGGKKKESSKAKSMPMMLKTMDYDGGYDPPPAAESAPMDGLAEEKSAPQYDFAAETIQGELQKPDGAELTAQRARGEGQGAQAQVQKQIVIRTQFPDTALWEPLRITSNREATFAIQFPDSITTQRLTLMASDKKGGIGLFKESVVVIQDLFVQGDVPAVMTLGDELQIGAAVRNMSKADRDVLVEFNSNDLAILGEKEQRIVVPGEEIGYVTWTVKPSRTGNATYTVVADSIDFRDEETRKTCVLPSGEPSVETLKGELSKERPFSSQLKIEEEATYTTAFLNVSMPNVIPAIQGWEAMNELPLMIVGVYGMASRAILDAALYEWGISAKRPALWLEEMKARLGQAAMALLSVQQDNGAFGWFYLADSSDNRSGFKTSAYLTAYVLRALLEVKNADLMVEEGAIAAAADHLMSVRNSEGLWSAQGAYFWEVNAPATDWALSAELFETISRARSSVGGTPDKELLDVKDKLEKKLRENPQEPAVVAHAMSALSFWAKWQGDEALGKAVKGRINYLLSLRREGYWEPHWYHAYGGMIELNALILEFLRESDPQGTEGVIREVVMWLLGTRNSWGAWHNEIGTANAVRALLKAGAGQVKEVASQIVVKVNGQEVARVDVDPDDPVLSAASLRQVELTAFLKPGSNKIEVTYGGNLKAPVVLESRQWGLKGVEPSKSPGGRLEIVRKAATQAKVGEPVEVELRVKSDKPMGLVKVSDSVPANMEAETESLRKLVQSGQILSFQRVADKIVFLLEKVDGEVVLKYRIVATREGSAAHAGTTVEAPYLANVRQGRTQGEPLEVK